MGINLIKNIDNLFISKYFLYLQFSITLMSSFFICSKKKNLNIVVFKID